MNKEIILTIVLVVLILVAAVKAEPNEPNSSSLSKVVVSGTGDSYGLMLALAKAMMTKVSDVNIDIQESIGSSGGIKAVISGKADLARVARELKDNEKAQGLTYQLFAYTPVVFTVNPGTNDINNITTEQILGIYSGKITNWSQLGSKAGKIYPLTREMGDSSLRILNEKLPGFADVNNPNAKVMYLTPETVATLERHKQTIGFVPLSAMVKSKLRILKVNGIEPSINNVLSNEYKFLIPLGVVYKGQPGEFTNKFIDFLYSKDGKKIIIEMGAVPAK